MKTDLQILQDARALIAKPNGWTKGATARNEYGYGVSPRDSSAVCFCSVGALEHALDADERRDAKHIHPKLAAGIARAFGLQGQVISAWNDHPDTTQAEVVAAFDTAIAIEAELTT